MIFKCIIRRSTPLMLDETWKNRFVFSDDPIAFEDNSVNIQSYFLYKLKIILKRLDLGQLNKQKF